MFWAASENRLKHLVFLRRPRGNGCSFEIDKTTDKNTCSLVLGIMAPHASFRLRCRSAISAASAAAAAAFSTGVTGGEVAGLAPSPSVATFAEAARSEDFDASDFSIVNAAAREYAAAFVVRPRTTPCFPPEDSESVSIPTNLRPSFPTAVEAKRLPLPSRWISRARSNIRSSGAIAERVRCHSSGFTGMSCPARSLCEGEGAERIVRAALLNRAQHQPRLQVPPDGEPG